MQIYYTQLNYNYTFFIMKEEQKESGKTTVKLHYYISLFFHYQYFFRYSNPPICHDL